MEKLKIGFISNISPENKKVWSGSIFRLNESFKAEGFKVIWIPIKYTKNDVLLFEKIEILYKKIFNRGFNKNHFAIKSRIAAKRIIKEIKKHDPDILFTAGGITEIAFLKTNKPIFYFNDANQHQLLNYYDGMSGFGFLSKKATEYVEKKALNNAAAVIFSSEWAADYAEKHYGINRKKIHINKFGANSNVSKTDRRKKRNLDEEIRFLFLGVEWKRKGGDITVDTVRKLRELGYPVSLYIVGCIPPYKISDDFITVIPFLNRNIPEEAQRLEELTSSADFLFVPTRAECYGVVFCEAAANGMPVIATDTGGISAIVENDRTGILLPLEATAENYAEEISRLLQDPGKIRQMSLAAKRKYEDELNWGLFGKKMKQIIENVRSKEK
ncbi:glycosyltransferase family 4 protein [uncultured Chryseobacterium sp.]|uniref:glycosyltransferase family 4 protein n=1 Tax=uncultured Chryseobacterium sp. TaxID=259322 RepID=UPI0026199FE6|nr:glycosyltransferase family 4 protein [uncultured Chryseobacterium sp.]